MLKRVLLPALVVSLLVAACASPTEPASLEPTDGPVKATVQDIPVVPTYTSEPEQEELIPEETPMLDGLEDECPGEAINTIGLGIADEYEFASYEEVMSWFCDGAEFEDILVALQTEDQTSFPAEEILVMLADGFSWEEIWLVVGLIE